MEPSSDLRVVHDRLRVVGRAQRQEKFDVTDTRVGGGIEWRATPSTLVAVSLMGGPGNSVLVQRSPPSVDL